jgi:type IV pilus assembly protein PilW
MSPVLHRYPRTQDVIPVSVGANTRARQSGFSLVELMIALVLGLVVIGGATSVFLSNKESYRSSHALSQIQENSRIAFELIARDARQAGLTGCGNAGRVGNVLKNGSNAGGTVAWWADFGNAIRGYDGNQTDPAVAVGSGGAARVAGTDSLTLIGAAESGFSIAAHDLSAGSFTLNEGSTSLQTGDIVVVCDPDHAVIAQISADTLIVGEDTDTPGNCSAGLGFPTSCTTGGNPYQFAANSQITQLLAVDWYIGVNPQNGRSLYRITPVVSSAGVPTPTAQEMVRNVTDLQVTYHTNGATDYQTAAAISTAGTWGTVDAIQITLTLQGVERSTGTDGQALSRDLNASITLRNRAN